MPNTEVKLQHAKSSWGIAPCEDRTLPRELESCPSWPKEQHWKCCIRVKACIKGSNPLLSVYDPLVKWLRHHPFTVVSWVRIPYGSLFGGLAQLGEHLPYKQEVTGSSPVSSIESLAQLVEHLTFNQRVGSSSLPRLIGPGKLKRVWRNWQTR